MSLRNSLKEIKTFLKKRYGKNLAAILVFGSANTGEWKEGISDIDLIILLKKGRNSKEEIEEVTIGLKELKISIVHLRSINNYEKHIYQKGSWSSWITVIDGSKKVYSTKEFRNLRKRLINKLIPKKKLIEYLKHKDKIELQYIKKDKGREKAKALFSHLRRKLQIINYLENKKIVFDYLKCLKKIDLTKEEKQKLKKLHKCYKKRKSLKSNEAKESYIIANKLTNKILKEI